MSTFLSRFFVKRAVSIVIKSRLDVDRAFPQRSEVEARGSPASHEHFDDVATLVRYHRDQEICREGASSEAGFHLVSGEVRRCVLRPDGRRQIVDFLLPGDFFGFALEETFDASAEAVSETASVEVYPRSRLERLAETSPAAAREMRKAALAEQVRQRVQCLILGRVTAVEKVGAFLLYMEERLDRDPSGMTSLPFSRYDVADYLAISVETVCRALTDLRRKGHIRFQTARTYHVIDAEALECGALH